MRIAVILTNDYEVYGNGRGCVKNVLIEPTDHLLSKFSDYGARHTIFFDVIEYWRFLEAQEKKYFGSDYRAADLIEAQLKNCISSGHDVQLHVHPQWLLAKPIDETYWKVNVHHWRTSKIPNGLGNIDDRLSVRGVLHAGKHTLESMLKPVDPNYECFAFRAGGYCMQPEEDVLQAMRDVGISLDSSVCPGRFLDRFPAYFDFRQAPQNIPFWNVSNNVNEPDLNGSVLELPVATFRQRRCSLSSLKRNSLKSSLRRAVLPQKVNLDYCKLTGPELIDATKIYVDRVKDRFIQDDGYLPVVLIGHSKEWKNQDTLDHFFNWIGSQEYYKIMTISEWKKQLSL